MFKKFILMYNYLQNRNKINNYNNKLKYNRFKAIYPSHIYNHIAYPRYPRFFV